MSERKLILYIAMSLDGYIATKDNDIGFLSIVEQKDEDYGYNDFIESVDTIIIGRKTYDKVIDMGYQYPHTDKTVYILSRTNKPDEGTYKYYTGELDRLINNLKTTPGKNIYCDGGAEIVNALINLDLIDEYIISVIPILIGSGIQLFKDNRPEQNLELIETKKYKKGLVQLHYKRKK